MVPSLSPPPRSCTEVLTSNHKRSGKPGSVIGAPNEPQMADDNALNQAVNRTSERTPIEKLERNIKGAQGQNNMAGEGQRGVNYTGSKRPNTGNKEDITMQKEASSD